jgi:ketosteroid isomerase-like protein
MRSHFSIALALVAFGAACTNEETVPRPPAPPVNWSTQMRASADAGPVRATDKERAAAGAYTKALVSPGLAQLASVLDEDAHFSFGGMKDAHGRDKVVEAHNALFGAFDQRSFVTTRLWITDSAQALEWTMTGVQAREWEGVAPTQKPATIKGLTLLWTNDDGSITDVHVTFDEAVVKVQLGAGPKELAGLPPPQAPPAGTATQELEQARSDVESSNVAQVRAWLSALEKGDEAGYLATMNDDVEVSTPERAQAARGKEEARTYYKTIRKEIGELDTSIDNVWGVKDFVIVEYFIVGTQLAPLGWIPLQRERLLKMAVTDVVELREGKIAHVWRYDNPAQVLTSP